MAVTGSQRCVYCGNPLPVVAPPASTANTPAEVSTRQLLIVETTGVEPDSLAELLGLDAAAAAARVRRGGWQRLRTLDEREAHEEALRLTRAGLRVVCLPEATVRAGCDPVFAEGGDPEAGAFVLRGGKAPTVIRPADVALVVWGTIRREYQAAITPKPRKGRRAPSPERPEELEVFHLHTHSRPQPLEIDALTFEFRPRPPLDPRLPALRDGLARLSGTVPIDRDFRFETPALTFSNAAQGEGDSALRAALGARSQGSREGLTLLDNLPQFRFFSAWRGLLARRTPD